jgi:hypothetical protein
MGVKEYFMIFGIFSILCGFIFNIICATKKELKEYGSTPNYIASIAFTLLVFCYYSLDSWVNVVMRHSTPHPDINLIFVILLIINLITTPFALAYVRCKEDGSDVE